MAFVLLLIPSVLKKVMKDTVEMNNFGSRQSLIYCSNYSGQYKVGATILAFPLFFAIVANSLVVRNKELDKVQFIYLELY